MAESAPSDGDAVRSVHGVGRITLWVVLALMAGAAIYAAWIAITNWTYIRV